MKPFGLPERALYRRWRLVGGSGEVRQKEKSGGRGIAAPAAATDSVAAARRWTRPKE